MSDLLTGYHFFGDGDSSSVWQPVTYLVGDVNNSRTWTISHTLLQLFYLIDCVLNKRKYTFFFLLMLHKALVFFFQSASLLRVSLSVYFLENTWISLITCRLTIPISGIEIFYLQTLHLFLLRIWVPTVGNKLLFQLEIEFHVGWISRCCVS